MDVINSYQKKYRLRLAQGLRRNSVEVTFPYDVVDKEARKLGLSVNKFIEQYQVVAFYNGFDGVLYKFDKVDNKFE